MEENDFKLFLSEKIYNLFINYKFKNAVLLFQEATKGFEVKIFYKENVAFLGLYSCEIIIDNKIFLSVCEGSTEEIAYQNTVRKFINFCLKKKKESFQFPEFSTDSFYTELKESITNINLTENLKTILQQYYQESLKNVHLSKMNSINYMNFKQKLAENNAGICLSESTRVLGEENLCSIYVNGNLLQQGTGKDLKDSLENTVTEFFKAYEIIPNDGCSNGNSNILNSNHEEILTKLSDLYKQKKHQFNGSLNCWDLIQDCVNSLGYVIDVGCGDVKINGMTIVTVDESIKYIAQIKAGMKLDEKLCEPRKKQPSYTTPAHVQLTKPVVLNIKKCTKILNKDNREEIMKNMVMNSHKEYLKDQRQGYWGVLNREFIKESFKVEPRYSNKFNEKICTLVLNEWEIISGVGIDKVSSRESAAKCLVDKYLSPVSST